MLKDADRIWCCPLLILSILNGAELVFGPDFGESLFLKYLYVIAKYNMSEALASVRKKFFLHSRVLPSPFKNFAPEFVCCFDLLSLPDHS